MPSSSSNQGRSVELPILPHFLSRFKIILKYSTSILFQSVLILPASEELLNCLTLYKDVSASNTIVFTIDF